MGKLPDDPLLSGVKMALQVGTLGISPSDERFATLLKKLPPGGAAGALTVALSQLSRQGAGDGLEKLAAVIPTIPGLADKERAALNIQVDLARIELLQRGPRTVATDATLRKLFVQARDRVMQADLGPDIKAALLANLGQVDASLTKAEQWQRTIASGGPPPEGFIELARDALAAGRLDIASSALLRQISDLSASADSDQLLRGFAQITNIVMLVQARLAVPGTTEQSKEPAKAFLDSVMKGLLPKLDDLIKLQGNQIAHSAANLAQMLERAKAGTITTEVLGRAKDTNARLVDRLRHLERMRLELSIANLPADQQANEALRQRQEFDRAVENKENELRNAFSGERDAVTTGEKHEQLARMLGELDALRAKRDAYTDYGLDKNPSHVQDRTTVRSRDVAIDRIELDLNGFNRDNNYNRWRHDNIWNDQVVKKSARADRNRAEAQTKYVGRSERSDAWRDLLIAENKIDYLERRRTQLALEDNGLSEEQRRLNLQERWRYEAEGFNAWGQNYILSDLGGFATADFAHARARYAQIEQTRHAWAVVDLETAAKNNDAQSFFRALVTLREQQLAGQIQAYSDYIGDADFLKFKGEFFTRGPLKGIRIGLYSASTGMTLEQASREAALLQPALIRASYHPVGQLQEADRQLLERHGYIQGGKYVIPREEGPLQQALIRAAEQTVEKLREADRKLLQDNGYIKDGRYVNPSDALSGVTLAGTEFATQGKIAQKIDEAVNLRNGAILAATVVLPGAAAGRVSSALISGTISRGGLTVILAGLRTQGIRAGATLAGRWMAEKAIEKTLEAALFTALSRGAHVALDPTMLLDERAWTVHMLGTEFLHNLAVMSALGVTGGTLGVGQRTLANVLGDRISGGVAYEMFRGLTGVGMIGAEAGIMTALDPLLSGNTLTTENFVANLMTVAMLKAAHVGPGEDLRADPRVGFDRFSPDYQKNWAETVRKVAATRAKPEAVDDYRNWANGKSRQEIEKAIIEDPITKFLRDKFGGSWDAARKAFKATEEGKITDKEKQVSKEQMDQLLSLRLKVVRTVLDEIVRELGGGFKALGTVSRTSDYDLSFYGWNAELAVVMFNARFTELWSKHFGGVGAESASPFRHQRIHPRCL